MPATSAVKVGLGAVALDNTAALPVGRVKVQAKVNALLLGSVLPVPSKVTTLEATPPTNPRDTFCVMPALAIGGKLGEAIFL